jgi:two-component system, NtrC family, nitrogen regulation sensor histidine kinase GlnL
MNSLRAFPTTAATDGLATLAEHLRTGIALADPNLQLFYVNPALSELLHNGGARYVGQALSVIADDGEALNAAARQALQREHPVIVRGAALLAGADERVAVDLALSPLEGNVLIEVHALGASAETGNGPSLSATLRGLAHEVKNPLAGVRGAAQLLRRHLADSELIELTDIIIAEADRLTALSDRLLRAGGKPHLSALNIHEVAERVRALVMAETDHATRIERDYDPSLPALRGDPDRLMQLLLNLVHNAIEAGAKVVRLRSRAEHGVLMGDRNVRLVVRLDTIDDGRGVDPDVAQTLFLPLVSGRAEGTGLGLPLCQEIAREHGGMLSYRSRPGDTVFTLRLPVSEAHG